MISIKYETNDSTESISLPNINDKCYYVRNNHINEAFVYGYKLFSLTKNFIQVELYDPNVNFLIYLQHDSKNLFYGENAEKRAEYYRNSLLSATHVDVFQP